MLVLLLTDHSATEWDVLMHIWYNNQTPVLVIKSVLKSILRQKNLLACCSVL